MEPLTTQGLGFCFDKDVVPVPELSSLGDAADVGLNPAIQAF